MVSALASGARGSRVRSPVSVDKFSVSEHASLTSFAGLGAQNVPGS